MLKIELKMMKLNKLVKINNCDCGGSFIEEMLFGNLNGGSVYV